MWAVIGAILGYVTTSLGESKKRSQIRKLNALNATRLESQAQAVERQTEEDVTLLRQRLTKTVGEQRATWGASGVSGGSGSALDVLAESITAGINDQRRRRETGEIAAADLRYAAKIGDTSARAAIEGSRSSTISAGGSALGEVISYAGKAYAARTATTVRQ